MRDLVALGGVGCVCIAAIAVAAIIKGFDTGVVTGSTAAISSLVSLIISHMYKRVRRRKR